MKDVGIGPQTEEAGKGGQWIRGMGSGDNEIRQYNHIPQRSLCEAVAWVTMEGQENHTIEVKILGFLTGPTTPHTDCPQRHTAGTLGSDCLSCEKSRLDHATFKAFQRRAP